MSERTPTLAEIGSALRVRMAETVGDAAVIIPPNEDGDPDAGEILVLHTVNPVANDYFPVYSENAREYCILESEGFGRMIQMEVGAMMVSRIINHPRGSVVRRGWEKGRFAFGGSTVILITRKGAAEPDGDILKNSVQGMETRVRLGERVGARE